jgi:hypothetical protein
MMSVRNARAGSSSVETNRHIAGTWKDVVFNCLAKAIKRKFSVGGVDF